MLSSIDNKLVVCILDGLVDERNRCRGTNLEIVANGFEGYKKETGSQDIEVTHRGDTCRMLKMKGEIYS